MHFWSFGAEDTVLASLAPSHCRAFVAAVIEWMFSGHNWDSHSGRKTQKFLIRSSLSSTLSISVSLNINVAEKFWIHTHYSSRTQQNCTYLRQIFAPKLLTSQPKNHLHFFSTHNSPFSWFILNILDGDAGGSGGDTGENAVLFSVNDCSSGWADRATAEIRHRRKW